MNTADHVEKHVETVRGLGVETFVSKFRHNLFESSLYNEPHECIESLKISDVGGKNQRLKPW